MGEKKREDKEFIDGASAASSDAEMSDSDRQAADQCIDKDGL